MTSGGADPEHRSDTRDEILDKAHSDRAGEGPHILSLRCEARSPDGPGEVPEGKDLMAPRTMP